MTRRATIAAPRQLRMLGGAIALVVLLGLIGAVAPSPSRAALGVGVAAAAAVLLLVGVAELRRSDAPVSVALRSHLDPLPVTLPPGVDVAARILPAEGALAGDWYDLVTLPDGRLGVAVGDVCGHGAEAGLLALRAKFALVSALRLGRDPGDVLAHVAEAFGQPESFVTAFVAVLDPITGECRFAGAGHPPALVIGEGGSLRLQSTGPLIGMFDAEWETRSTVVDCGATLVLYTDGLTEAHDRKRDEFGVDRVIGACAASGVGASAADTLASLIEAVGAHNGDHDGGRLADDVTVVVIRRLTRP